ncbi:hypothetical protein ACH4B4_39995, partial [Streptomyces tendae]
MNKKTKLRIALASAALVVAAATGTALAAGDSGSDSGSERPSTAQSKQNGRDGQAGQQTPAPIKTDGANVFPHSLDFDAPSKSFYVGSLKHGTVSTVGTDGKVRTF